MCFLVMIRSNGFVTQSVRIITAYSFELLKKVVLSVDYEFVEEKHKLLLDLNHRSAYDDKAYFERIALIRELSELCVNSSFLYLLEPDSSLLSITKGLISAVCSADIWLNQRQDFKAWKSDLTTADIGVNIAVAFENIKDQMPEDYRQEVTTSLLNKCFYPLYEDWLPPEKHVNALDTMGHNWWNVCISGMGVVLLIVGKSRVEHFETCLDQIIDSLREWMNYPGNVLQNKKANFGNDGDFLEYIGYFIYALSNYCIFNEILKKDYHLDVLDFSELEEKTVDYYSSFFHMLWDGPRFADFGDISLIIEKHSQYIFYLCGKYNKSWTQNNFKQICTKLAMPYEFYFYNPDIANNDLLPPNEKIFHYSGYAVIRSGFTADDTSFIKQCYPF